MRVHVYCTDSRHPVLPYLRRWMKQRKGDDEVLLCLEDSQLSGGDILFLVSVARLVPSEVRQKYRAAIVLHASDLPKGRGWSPVVWQILEGARKITVTALTAVDKVDTGDIWMQETFSVQDHEVFSEISHKLFTTELALMDRLIAQFDRTEPMPQPSEGATYYRKRTPEDSRIDPERPISEQFDLMRACDPERYPAFFEFRGQRYRILIDKLPRKTQ